MFRKKLAFLCAALILLSTGASAAVNVHADSTPASKSSAGTSQDGTEMQNALALFKSKITIPKEYSVFTYSTSEDHSMPSYKFRWTTDDKNQLSCTGTVTGGMITRYSKPNTASGSPCFSPFTIEELKQKALDWLAEVNPETKGHLELAYDIRLSLTNNEIYMRFVRTNDGVKLEKNSVSVTIDKMTGEITDYYCNWWQNASFPDAEKAISQESIQKIYREETDIKPWYRLKYDYKTDKTTAQIVYVPLSSNVYNALDGSHTTIQDDYKKAMNTDYYDDFLTGEGAEDADAGYVDDSVETVAAPEANVNFTDEELNALKEQQGLLTEKEFRELMYKDPYIELTSSYITEYFDISANKNTESGYSISASFLINNDTEYKEYTINADAETGKVLNFNYYDGTSSNDKLIDVKTADELAKKAAEYYYGDVFDRFVADTENTAPAVRTKDYKETSRTMHYYRYENNIQVDRNNIIIEVDNRGKVQRINCNYTKDVDFGDGKVLPKNAIFDKLFEQQDMKLYYDGFTDLQSVPHTYLHYTCADWTVNAKTGQLCDYYGDPVKEKEEQPVHCPYTDIADSPYRDEIIALYEHDVVNFKGNMLMPKKTITFEEMGQLFGSVLYQVPVPEEGEENKPATRLMLAKHLISCRGYSNSAELKGIFKSPFKDVSDDDENVGYIAICHALDILPEDASGNFSPNAVMSREYAMHCLYYYVTKTYEKNQAQTQGKTQTAANSGSHYSHYVGVDEAVYEEVAES